MKSDSFLYKVIFDVEFEFEIRFLRSDLISEIRGKPQKIRKKNHDKNKSL